MTPPLRPDSPTAHRWLADELAESRYSGRSWQDRLEDWWASFFDPGNASAATVNVIIAIMIGALLVLLLVLLVRRFPRGVAPRKVAGHPESAVGPLDEPDRHRNAAAVHRAAGDQAAAVIESYRALVSASAEREILAPTPGLTAQRAARQLTTRFFPYAPELAQAADCFDRARYARVRLGGSVITEADAEFVADLEQRVAATAPAATSVGRRGER